MRGPGNRVQGRKTAIFSSNDPEEEAVNCSREGEKKENLYTTPPPRSDVYLLDIVHHQLFGYL